MGKGLIKSELGDGEYSVEIMLHRETYNAKIAKLDARIAELAGAENKTLRLSYERKKRLLEKEMPDNVTTDMWCADSTTGLSGNVGTIEVPGERQDIFIQPGYDGNAEYDSSRDGQLQPAIAAHPWNNLYNWCLFPGWQKWMPTYRTGVARNIDRQNNTCDVYLDSAKSSIQNINVNTETVLSDVEIDYENCNAFVFTELDEVIVKFDGQSWDNPKVIGFVSNPQKCPLWYEPWTEDDLTANNFWWIYAERDFSYPPYYEESEELGGLGWSSVDDGRLSFIASSVGDSTAIELDVYTEFEITGATYFYWKTESHRLINSTDNYDQIIIVLGSFSGVAVGLDWLTFIVLDGDIDTIKAYYESEALVVNKINSANGVRHGIDLSDNPDFDGEVRFVNVYIQAYAGCRFDLKLNDIYIT